MTVRDLIILGCSSQQPTRFRNHNAYLIRWNNEGLLFDPGEGTQRQFIFADIAPTCVKRILISHFHGDHCLGLGSMLMRLNLDKVTHPIHCYYPASGKKYFDRLRYGTMYHEMIQVVEHPISNEGIIDQDDTFKIEAVFLNHGVDNLAYRVTEKDERKFDKTKLEQYQILGPMVRALEENKKITIGDKTIYLDDVSSIRPGESVVVLIDTRPSKKSIEIARNARILLAESTYLESEHELAVKHLHMTAKEAATIARDAKCDTLILTHFSARYLNVRAFEEEARTIFSNSYAAEDLKRFPFAKKKG